MTNAKPSLPTPPEPWMRGTHTDLDPLLRAVVHALELADEDAERWCAPLSTDELLYHPVGLPPVAFHLRHIARSLDRLLTYAEAPSPKAHNHQPPLSPAQMTALQSEKEPQGSAADIMAEFRAGIRSATERIRAFNPESFPQPRGIGRERLPTTVAGLLIHCAEHTSRHIGQAVTTAKLVKSENLRNH